MLNTPTDQLISDIYSACHAHGFFHLINHGVPVEVCKGALDAVTEFFELGHSEKAGFVTETHMEDGKIYKYYVNAKQACDDGKEEDKKVEMWGEALFHTWSPVNYAADNLPPNPPHLRKAVMEYTNETGKLMKRLLSLMSKGLDLNEGQLEESLGENPSYTAQTNYYPPSPEPQQTLGLREHNDMGVITVLLQEEGVTGLHVKHGEEWVAVEPHPNALFINFGDQMEVLSNGRYKSPAHRAVTNKDKRRVSYALFCGPNEDAEIGPIDALIDEGHPPVYKRYRFGDFIQEFRNQKGRCRKVKELYLNDPDTGLT